VTTGYHKRRFFCQYGFLLAALIDNNLQIMRKKMLDIFGGSVDRVCFSY
jgi:hypothetical protein